MMVAFCTAVQKASKIPHLASHSDASHSSFLIKKRADLSRDLLFFYRGPREAARLLGVIGHINILSHSVIAATTAE